MLRRPVESAQYVSIRYTERLAEAGIEPSVGSKGDSYDNALAETINGLYKAELIHRRAPWKTRESVELATLEWVSWFNHHSKRSATPSTPGSRNSVLVSTPNGVDTCPLQFLLNSASAYACPAVGQ